MKRLIVIGSVNQDIVIKVQEAPKAGQTVVGDSLQHFPGGKGANQAVAAQLYSDDATFLGKIGTDPAGTKLKEYLRNTKLKLELIEDSNFPTGTALIIVDQAGENRIVVAAGANAELSAHECLQRITFRSQDHVVFQNEIPFSTTQELLAAVKTAGGITVYNPAPPIPYNDILKNVDYLIVNEHEYETLFQEKISSNTEESLAERTAGTNSAIILTLGAKGAISSKDGKAFRCEGIKVKAVDTTGAGDCFVGAFAAQIHTGSPAHEALKFANNAAATSATRPGASSSFLSSHEI